MKVIIRFFTFFFLVQVNFTSLFEFVVVLQVYLSLCCALIAAAVGSYLHILWNIGGLLTTLAGMGSIVWLLSTPPYEEVRHWFLFLLHLVTLLSCTLSWTLSFLGKQKKRVTLFMASALLQGASIGPLIELAIEIDPRQVFLPSLLLL